jgi:excisionase family DNA binding protein
MSTPNECAPDFYTPDEIRQKLNIGRNTLYRALERGEIPGQVRIGKLYRIRKSVFDAHGTKDA